MRSQICDEQLVRAGIPNGKYHALAYRVGLVLQVFGAGLLAVLYPINHPFYTMGIMVFELGALLSGLTLHLWTTWIKKVILGSILSGIFVQILGLYFTSAEYALPVTFAGIGMLCFGTAGMAGKEAYCFSFREGWILMCLYPVMVLMTFLGNLPQVLYAMLFSLHFLLLLFLTGKKLRQPLLPPCTTDTCRTPKT